MIISDQEFPFGGRVTTIDMESPNGSYVITISTAKEGFFQGLSTVIVYGTNAQDIYAKLRFNKTVSRNDRIMLHQWLVKWLLAPEMKIFSFSECVKLIVNSLAEKGLLEKVEWLKKE